ncbi:hemerythrin domain-containing protein [Catenulispora pinisilvae]|uniref:hemerythrin domain-containing protein n=1 Tax=Catenulispora pinisilvae TaxID=2705253 RepID=UPI0018922922|nr:hemerythrin domain-containing protein [Catenulispora pinisilvae]
MGHGGNIIEELTADHRRAEAMFDVITGLPARSAQRRKAADEFTVELVRHSVAEERDLYPAVREHVQDGDELADLEIVDHTVLEQHLKTLEMLDADHADFDRLVETILIDVTAHFRDEEDRLFPLLAAACTPEQLNGLGDKVRAARKQAPAGPWSSDATSPNRFLAPGPGLVDRARNYFTGRGW